MEDISKNIAQKLLHIKAIKLSPQKPFAWASGLRSPIYCDNRIILSHPRIRAQVIRAFQEKAKAFAPFDGIAGVATAGIAHGALLAQAMDLPFIYVRSKAKEHGRQNLIEGEWQVGKRWLIIEDLISTGGSAFKAVEALRAVSCEAIGVMAIFTYGFPAVAEKFEKAGCPLDTLSNYPALLAEAIREKYITATDLAILEEWNQDPKAWSQERKR